MSAHREIITFLCPHCETAERERDAAKTRALIANKKVEFMIANLGQVAIERDEARATVHKIADCGQGVVCSKPPGCQRHWSERNRELVAERDEARGVARILAHAYETDNRPPDQAVSLALAYPVWPDAISGKEHE